MPILVDQQDQYNANPSSGHEKACLEFELDFLETSCALTNCRTAKSIFRVVKGPRSIYIFDSRLFGQLRWQGLGTAVRYIVNTAFPL